MKSDVVFLKKGDKERQREKNYYLLYPYLARSRLAGIGGDVEVHGVLVVLLNVIYSCNINVEMSCETLNLIKAGAYQGNG